MKVLLKPLKYILTIIIATIGLVISLVVGLFFGIGLGFIAWNAGINKFNEVIEEKLKC